MGYNTQVKLFFVPFNVAFTSPFNSNKTGCYILCSYHFYMDLMKLFCQQKNNELFFLFIFSYVSMKRQEVDSNSCQIEKSSPPPIICIQETAMQSFFLSIELSIKKKKKARTIVSLSNPTQPGCAPDNSIICWLCRTAVYKET